MLALVMSMVSGSTGTVKRKTMRGCAWRLRPNDATAGTKGRADVELAGSAVAAVLPSSQPLLPSSPSPLPSTQPLPLSSWSPPEEAAARPWMDHDDHARRKTMEEGG